MTYRSDSLSLGISEGVIVNSYLLQQLLERTSINPNLRLALGYFIQQIRRNVWIIEFKANLIPRRDCPNADLNKVGIL